MDVDLIPKKPVEKPLWQTILFYLSFIFLFISLLSLFFLNRSNKSANLEIEKINQELNRERTTEEISLEKDVLRAQKRIAGFSLLASQRKPLSLVFDQVEKLVHPQVFFTNLNFNAKENKLWLGGKADNFQVLGQQARLFREEPLIRESSLEQAGIGKQGGVEFEFEIFFDPKVFQK
ncbi:MAG: hypothetical protein HY577_00480 [Candidatus Nealsonbacteria bacterium]|nr:hypothetical protein [Candidatus Nealsonbacteria bacterium]